MSGRVFVIRMVIVATVILFSIKLFNIQILDDNYKVAAENNVVQKIIQYPHRGLIYDSKDSLLVYNSPVFDLMVVPKEARVRDTLAFCQLLGISVEEFVEKMDEAWSYSPILASRMIKQLPNHLFGALQDKLVEYPGFYVLPRTIRSYATDGMANVLGYIGEVSEDFLKKDASDYYKPGDYMGIGGLERSYEGALRGRRGATYKVVNVQGIIKDDFKDGKYDTLPQRGDDIRLTIDLELQRYAEKLMQRKVGSVVAIEPSSGKILALVSSPSYDPSFLSGSSLGRNFPSLVKNPNKPLFNRPLQARYPPGSMFKTLQGIIAMHEGVVHPDEIITTDGSNIGDLAPPGQYNMEKAITYSSNNYFYIIMRRMIQQGVKRNAYMDARPGLEKWREYVKLFGLGRKLGIDIPNEISGNIPGVEYYDKLYGINRWKYSTIGSLSIGQGEILVTPLQIANLGAILANRGYFITPHVVDRIGEWPNSNIKKEILPFDEQFFDHIIRGMERVVRFGSGFRGYRDSLFLCGKTSTVQNPHGEDHSGFMGFAPREDPKIAVAAFVENAGQGGRAAVSVASLVVEKYMFGEISRPMLEDYVIREKYLSNVARSTIPEN